MGKVAIYATVWLVAILLPTAYWYETKDLHIELKVDKLNTNKFFRQLEEAYRVFLRERYKPYQIDV